MIDFECAGTANGRLALALAAVAVVGLTSCSSSSAPPARGGGGGNPCAALPGQPVGKEVGVTETDAGHLVSPPKACADVAELESSGGCYPGKAVTGNRVADFFWFTYKGVTAYGKPGSTWHVTTKDFNPFVDRKKIDC